MKLSDEAAAQQEKQWAAQFKKVAYQKQRRQTVSPQRMQASLTQMVRTAKVQLREALKKNNADHIQQSVKTLIGARAQQLGMRVRHEKELLGRIDQDTLAEWMHEYYQECTRLIRAVEQLKTDNG